MSDDADARHGAARRLLGALVRAQWLGLTAATVSALAWLGCGIATPLAIGWTVQRGIVDGDRATLWWGAAAIVVLGAGESAADAARHWVETAAAERTRTRLRGMVADAALALDPTARARWSSGQIAARATSDSDTIADTFESAGYSLAFLASLPVVVVLLVRVDPVVAAALFGIAAVTLTFGWLASRLWAPRLEASQTAAGDTVAAAQSAIEGLKVIVAAGDQHGVLTGYVTRSAASRDRALAVSRLSLWFEPTYAALASLSTLTVLVVGGARAIDGTTNLGAVIAALGLAGHLGAPIETATGLLVRLRGTLVAAVRIVSLTAEAPEPAVDSRRCEPLAPAAVSAPHDDVPAMLVAQSLGVHHPGMPAPVLADVSFTAAAGDVVSVDGPLGSGKSTLAAVLAGELRQTSGSVSIGGVDPAVLPPAERAARVLRLDTEPFLVEASIATNVRLGAPDAPDTDVEQALRTADAAEFVAALPDGIDTVLSARGASLSGGQRQRLALARALLVRPAVLVLDSALSGLEPERELAVTTAVLAACRDGVVVLTSTTPAVRALATSTVALPPPRWHQHHGGTEGDA